MSTIQGQIIGKDHIETGNLIFLVSYCYDCFMSFKRVKDFISDRPSSLPASFCPVPFTTVILEPDGSVGMCRHLGSLFAIGNLKEQTLYEIWNGEKARNWRREFLQNDIKICSEFVRERQCHLTLSFNALFNDAVFTEVQTTPILKLTANFNGECNLRCQMCPVWKLPNGFYTEDNFWKDARLHLFPSLKEIDMLSGEPFIQEDTFKLIREMLVINPTCCFNFTTNLHWEVTPEILELLNKIYIRSFSISIDSLIPEIYHKIRPPGNLSFVLNNVDKILSLKKGHAHRDLMRVAFNMTVQKDNWTEVPAVFDYIFEKGLDPYIFVLKKPRELSLLDFPQIERERILNYYLEEIPRSRLVYAHMLLRPLIFSLDRLDQARYLLQLKDIFSQ